ncbi:hypothetical protein NGRA_1031 [Nosema granulosis]|uniref:Uncharacterized protein n=1 Tax=Nosema granulosis TaxID=83296 RepID=A0A9P6H0V7_9MICR|nr:hypothetical protein NGRA_1031 [Nosema granulosis]
MTLLRFVHTLILINMVRCESSSDEDYEKYMNSSSDLLSSDFSDADMTEVSQRMSNGFDKNKKKKYRYNDWQQLFLKHATSTPQDAHDSDCESMASRGIISNYCRRKRLGLPDTKEDDKAVRTQKKNDKWFNRNAMSLSSTSEDEAEENPKVADLKKRLREAARERLENDAFENHISSPFTLDLGLELERSLGRIKGAVAMKEKFKMTPAEKLTDNEKYTESMFNIERKKWSRKKPRTFEFKD